MATPLEMIEKGICEENLELVRDGYLALTGKFIDLKLNNENNVLKIADELPVPTVKKKRGRPKKSVTEPLEKSQAPNQSSNYNKIKNLNEYYEKLDDEIRKDKKIRFRQNTFVDFGIVDAIDKKIGYPTNPTERRPPMKMAKIKCSKCKQSFEIHPSLAFGEIGQLCKECLGEKRSGR